MDNISKQFKNGVLIFKVSTELYQKEAILMAAHKFIDRCYVDINPSSEKCVSVSLHPKDKNLTPDDIALEFCNELLDQQVRLNIEKSYGNIRDLIVKQAFQPVENIRNEIKI
ncbi:MAG: His-Xaa-Ser system protein HxsD [Sedimentisphaerales bacterium]